MFHDIGTDGFFPNKTGKTHRKCKSKHIKNGKQYSQTKHLTRG